MVSKYLHVFYDPLSSNAKENTKKKLKILSVTEMINGHWY